jgi:hypothetical protein
VCITTMLQMSLYVLRIEAHTVTELQLQPSKCCEVRRKKAKAPSNTVAAFDSASANTVAAFDSASVCRMNSEPLLDVQKAIGKHSAKRRKGEGSDDEDEGGSRRKKGRVGRVKNRRVPKKPKQSSVRTLKGGVGKKSKGSKPKKG